MENHETESKPAPPGKETLRKRGVTYLIIFIVCLAISLIMYSAGIQGGIIYALISLAWVVFFVMAVVTLIRGFSKK